MMMVTPCGHLIERDPPECAMGRKAPDDCRRACAYYTPGLTDQERVRCEIWARIRGTPRYTFAEGEGHD
jgi:hypothetical protein